MVLSNFNRAYQLVLKMLLTLISKISVLSVFGLSVVSCRYSTTCERYYVPKDFIGRVVVIYNQKSKEREKHDAEGCITYEVSLKGECYNPYPYRPTVGVPDKTVRYFERTDKDVITEIFMFQESKYLQDTLMNRGRKYAFIISAAFADSIEYKDFYIDYGRNYKRHSYLY